MPAGVVHDAHNEGAVATKLVGVYVVQKGKPLATPAAWRAGIAVLARWALRC